MQKLSTIIQSETIINQSPEPSKSCKLDCIGRYPVDEIYIKELKLKFVEFLKDEFFFESDKLEIDSKTKSVLNTIFDWILGKYEPDKGFVLFGTYGTGKSSIMKAAMKLIFHIYGKSDIQPLGINEPKYITSKKLARLFIDNEKVKINELIYAKLIGIDDFGYESKEVRTFGTIVFPFEEILMERYDKKKIILATTNLKPEQIEKAYGGHILDRLKQMCFWIEINALSKRK